MRFSALYGNYRYWGGVVAIGTWGGIAGVIAFFRFFGFSDIAPFWVPIVLGGAALAGAGVFVVLFLFFQWIFIDGLKSLLGFHR